MNGDLSGMRALCRPGSRRNSKLGNLRYPWRNIVSSGGGQAPTCTPSAFGGEGRAQRSKKPRNIQNGFWNRGYKMLRENV